MISATDTLFTFLHHVYVPSRLELSVGWIRQLDVTVRQFERWAERPISVCDLSEALIRRFLADYRRDHSPVTTNNKRRHLLGLWECAYQEEIVARPPRRSKVRKAKEHLRIPEAWTAEEVGRIIQAAKQETRPICQLAASDWWTSLLLAMYDTGERRGAVLKVTPSDISHADAVGGIVFRHTKTGRPRYCALAADTMIACLRIYDVNRALMWPWHASPEYLTKVFRRILKRAGVKYGREHGGVFHKLRRTSGTLVEQGGGDGARHIGCGRTLFLRHYRDPRFGSTQLGLLPRPH